MKQELLTQLPKIDLLLSTPPLAESGLPHHIRKTAARQTVEKLRGRVLSGELAELPGPEAVAAEALTLARRLALPRLRRVVNATGVVLHTNLGRAPMSEEAALAAYTAARCYSNLEYDLEKRVRGSRGTHVEALLCALTGAEAALVVNNNAAAVFLLLSTLARGKGVAISRGELVEIGGAFRMPDIIARSGARLVEVGTTNKTRPADYEAVLANGTAQALLKVHPSNFQVVGFTQAAGLDELSALARQYELPLFCDLGSGVLDGRGPWPQDYPTVTGSVTAADVVCFSGDKLLGGPQAGILAGRKCYIDQLCRDPLFRALRMDKLSLAALEATLRAWADPEGRDKLPVPAMLGADPAALRAKAEALARRLEPICAGHCAVSAAESQGEAGGGTLPGVSLPAWVAALSPTEGSPEALEAYLRGNDPPILGRIHRDRLLLDVRTLLPGDEEEIVRALTARFGGDPS